MRAHLANSISADSQTEPGLNLYLLLLGHQKRLLDILQRLQMPWQRAACAATSFMHQKTSLLLMRHMPRCISQCHPELELSQTRWIADCFDSCCQHPMRPLQMPQFDRQVSMPAHPPACSQSRPGAARPQQHEPQAAPWNPLPFNCKAALTAAALT